MISKKEIRQILNLHTTELIKENLASRQLEIIYKAYGYLSKPGNNIIYLADEVGLGKTYIAAGIAMLFRHYSQNIENHKDLIIVPKKNLQDKWRKELNNFIKKNFIADNDKLKTQILNADSIKEQILPVRDEDPVSIFRMTSFSAISSHKKGLDLYNYLLDSLFDHNEFAVNILKKARSLGYFNVANESAVRKLVACLLNALSPKINCLIVDEAHNYKHGIGNDAYDTSIRNELTARFLGAYKDHRILKDFPELKQKLKFPLADKVICLSATPKDRCLMEIQRQFNCFTISHLLNGAECENDVQEQLSKFLIRGNLEYNIGGDPISRNQCRHEHRAGNTNKSLEAEPLTVSDGFESLLWQLIQYRSIKQLQVKNNGSFETGMLAGFESYQLDVDKRKIADETEDAGMEGDGKVYDLTSKRNIQESQDYNIIKQIMDSYSETFNNELPPHPKMTRLENEIIEQLNDRDKSLIFVRRVATAYELERRLLHKYENDIVVNKQLAFPGKFKKFKSEVHQTLLQEFSEKNIINKLDDFWKLLISRQEVAAAIGTISNGTISNEHEAVFIWLGDAYKVASFKELVNAHIKQNRTNISKELKDSAIEALTDTYDKFRKDLDEGDEDVPTEDNNIDSGYFFLNYFKKGQTGYKYRAKMYRENWFDVSVLALNQTFRFVTFNEEDLARQKPQPAYKKKKKHQLFQQKEIAIRDFLRQNGSLFNEEAKPDIKGKYECTFLDRLLTEHCEQEMRYWFSIMIKKYKFRELLEELELLAIILKNIFRNGSGLLPGFIADGVGGNYEELLIELITDPYSPFDFVLNEVKTIIRDFELLTAVNFQEKKEERINRILSALTPVIGTTGRDKIDRGILAARFRMPGFPYVLVTTDIFREGEDLHTYCQNIYHYGIAWNPSDMEQRTGRIDRINSFSYRKINEQRSTSFNNQIQVFYPYLRQSVEVNQVKQLLTNMNKFVKTFNDIGSQNTYESTVPINNGIEDMPEQIKEKLISRFDVDSFNG